MNDNRKLCDKSEINGELDGCIIGSFSSSPFGGNLYVDTNDSGEKPHFHIRNYRSGTNNNYGFLTGIEFQRPAYFHQQSANDVLDDEEKVALNEFFNMVVDRKNFKEAGITVWDMCCILWNWNNPDNELSDELEMPDYTKLSVGKG